MGTNSMWEDKTEVKKGNIGEQIVEDYLIKQGIIPYRPCTDGAHPFDRLCASADKQRIFVAEIKSKPARYAYPDTGINYSHYCDYMNIAMKYSMDIFLYFVDEHKGCIYGAELVSRLVPEYQIEHNGKLLSYPMHQSHYQNGKQIKMVYFPIKRMKFISSLTTDQCLELKVLSTSKTHTQGHLAYD